MNCNVLFGERYAKVPDVGDGICHDSPGGAIELRSLAGGGHEVDWDGVHGRLFGCIENESILLPFLDKVVL